MWESATATAVTAASASARERRWRRRISPAARGGTRLGSWLLVGQTSGAAGQFAFSVMRARSLSLEDFGAWAFAGALVSIAGVLADFGLGVVAVRDLARDESNARAYLRTATAAGLLLAGAANVAVLAVLAALRPPQAATFVALVFGAQLFVTGYAIAPFGYLRARQQTAWECVGRLAQMLVLLIGGGAVWWFRLGIPGFAGVALLATTISIMPVMAAVWRRIGLPLPAFEPTAAVRLLRTAAPVGIGMAATTVYYYADTVLLGAFGEHRAVALYGAAYTLLFGVVLIVSVLHSTFLPLLSRAASNAAEFASLSRSFVRISAVLGVCVAAAGLLSARVLLTTVYGDEYGGGETALRLLFLTGGIMFLSSAFGTMVLAARRDGAYLRVVLLGACVNIILNVILIPRYSLAGAASATLAAETTVCVMMAIQRIAAIPPHTQGRFGGAAA